jgi:prevent-host-death family protein
MTIYGGHMKTASVSIADGKKGFSRLIQEACQNKEEIIVTRRGKPVAVIVPYEEYRHSRKAEGYRKIMEARDVLSKTSISAGDIYRESRKQLEKRP